MNRETLETSTRSVPAPRASNRYPADLVDFIQEASLGVVMVDAQGTIRWANRAAHDGLGYSREEFIGKNYAELVASPEECEFILGKVFDGQVITNYQVTLRHASGELRTFVLDGSADFHEEGVRARLITRDITWELQTAKMSRLRADMLDAVGQAVIVTDLEGRITYWNRAAEEIYGWTAQEAAGRQVIDLIVPDEWASEAREIIGRLSLGQRWSGEFVLRRKDGRLFPAFVSDAPLSDESGRVVAFVGVTVDITDLRTAREESESAKSQLSIVLRGISDGVIAEDREGHLIYANDAAARLVGLTSVEEMLQASPAELLGRFDIEDEGGQVLAQDQLPAACAWNGEAVEESLLKFRRRDTGEEQHWLVRAAAVPGASGAAEYVVQIFRDVTERVIAERERERLLASEQQARLTAEKAAARMAVLQNVTALLSKALTQKEVSAAIVVQGVAATGASAGAMAMIDGDEACLIATVGYDDDFLQRWQRFKLSNPMPVTHTLRTGEEVFIDLEQAEKDYSELVGMGLSKSWATVPVYAENRVVGAISLSFSTVKAFWEEERETIRTLATLCSQALDRARLYEVERRLRQEAQASADLLLRVQHVTDAALGHPEMRTLPELLATIRDVIQADIMSILLLDETDDCLVPVASIGIEEVASGIRVPVGKGFAGRIAAERQPLIVDRPEEFPFVQPLLLQNGLLSIAGIPLIVEDRVTGVLYAGMYERSAFTQWHIRLLELVADRVAMVLAQSRLFEAERRARAEAERVRERVTRLQSITAALAGAWTPQEAAEVVLQAALETLQAESAGVAVVNTEGRFEILAAHGFSETQLDKWGRLPWRAQRALAEVVSAGEALIFPTREDFRRRYPSFVKAFPDISPSTACVTLRAGARVLGGLMVGFAEERELSADDRTFLMSMAQQCALAVARTQLHEAERRARALSEDAEARYRLLAETLPLIVWTATAQGKIDYCNARFYEYTGLPPGENVSWGWQDVLHPEDAPTFVDAWQTSVSTGEGMEVEVRLRKAAGGYSWFLERALPAKDASGATLHWLGTLTNIDDQKHAQERLAFLAEASGILSSSLEYENTLKDVACLAVERLADWAAVHFVTDGGTITRLALAHRDPERLRLAQEMDDGEPLSMDSTLAYAYVIRTGREQLIKRLTDEAMATVAVGERQRATVPLLGIRSVLSVPIVVRGRTKGALTLAMAQSGRQLDERDLQMAREFSRHIAFAVETAMLYRESQAIQEELRFANEAKDEFLGLMSHELRTPITTLYGGAKILRSRGRYLSDEHKESLLNDIETEAEGMHRMIEDLLVLARTGSGDKIGTEPVLANRLVEQVVRRFQLHKPGREVHIRSEPDLLPVMGETTYLEQVLGNLLSNADKYSSSGQPVEVELRNDGERVVIAVLDRGSGIDPEEADLIFNRFYRAERTARGVRGMGLGLTVCKKLIEAQGGRIWAAPREGGGTVVAFSLPAFTAGYDEI